MIKFFIEVVRLGVADFVLLALVSARLRLRKEDRRRYVVAFALIVSLLATGWIVAAKVIPGYVNKSELTHIIRCVHLAAVVFYMVTLFGKLENRTSHFARTVLLTGTSLFIISSSANSVPDMLLLSNTLVPYGGHFFETDVLLKVVGFLLGIIFLVFVFVSTFKCTRRLSGGNQRLVTGLLLVMQVVIALGAIMLRMYSRNKLPKNQTLFSVLAALANAEILLIYVSLAIAALMPVLLMLSNRVVKESYSNPAELRKIKARMRSVRRWSVALATAIIFSVLTLSVLNTYVNREVTLSEPEEYSLSETEASIPLSLLDDDKLHRFSYKAADGADMRFIALRKAPGSYVAALDACNICGPSGYYERGDEIVCKLCDVVMNRATIGFPGGCNPIPLEFDLRDNHLVVSRAELDAHANIFH